jgi:hypothetical protein
MGGFLHSYTSLFHHFLKVVTSPSRGHQKKKKKKKKEKKKQFTIVRKSFITKTFLKNL